MQSRTCFFNFLKYAKRFECDRYLRVEHGTFCAQSQHPNHKTTPPRLPNSIYPHFLFRTEYRVIFVSAVLPGFELWYDRVVRFDDLERTDGRHRKWESHRSRSQVRLHFVCVWRVSIYLWRFCQLAIWPYIGKLGDNLQFSNALRSMCACSETLLWKQDNGNIQCFADNCILKDLTTNLYSRQDFFFFHGSSSDDLHLSSPYACSLTLCFGLHKSS